MRKFYFALIMALSATMAGAAHNPTLTHLGRNSRISPEKLTLPVNSPAIDALTIKDISPKHQKRRLSAQSRADETESFDFANYYLWSFYDPDVNFYDDRGYYVSVPTDYISSAECSMVSVGDSTLVYGFGYYEDVPYRFYVAPNADGNLTIKLGQKLYPDPVLFYVTDESGVTREQRFNMYLGGAFLDYIDPENPEAGQTLVTSVSREVGLYMSPENTDIISTDAYALYVMLQVADDPTAEMISYRSILFTQFCRPNSTIGYECLFYDESGEPYVERVNMPVYAEFAENSYAPYPDEDPNLLYDSYIVSNVTPYGMGIAVSIARFEVDEEYSPTGFLWLADSQPAFPAQTFDSVYSGKLYMNSVYVDNNLYYQFTNPSYPQVSFSEATFKDINGAEYDALVFPNAVPDVNEEISYWGLSSKTQDIAIGYYGQAVLVFDFVGDVFTGTPGEAGIQDVITDSFDGAPEYYDLQGIKVVNPVAGKVYIVKEGSKVTKRIFR